MNIDYPVYTLRHECSDCYKCIRECPVKAIKIESGHASVISNKCVACGHCVTVCPQKAKKIRNDGDKIKKLIKSKKVYVSLAPSWKGSFSCSDHCLITALKSLGFADVSETALGAEQVSLRVVEMLNSPNQKLYISSACPAVVDYIKLYQGEYAKFITPIASPALTHAKMLKKIYGENIGVVFIGPCIAKKNESDRHNDLIDATLTFNELQNIFKVNEIELEAINSNENLKFVPEKSHEGNTYPIEGGMNKTISHYNVNKNIQLLSISSMSALKKLFENLDLNSINETIFIEALACEGGCTGGPGIGGKKSNLAAISAILANTRYQKVLSNKPTTVVTELYLSQETPKREFSSAEISMAMKSIGKHSKEDELDCGGCGHNTCQGLAEALLAKEAEPSMCISYMRRIAMQKANSMLRCMPSAVVMVDKEFKIIESNEAFASMFAGEILDYYRSNPDGFAGAYVGKFIPFLDVFTAAIRTGKDIHKERYPVKSKLYDITAFVIEPKTIVGAIITDVTKTEMKRDQIAKRANEVITKNISIAQNIACLLGEHMVETELLLSSIADGYEVQKNPEENDGE